MSLKVSIVITCYNLGEYLLEALNSIDNNLPYLETIIVDDGSTDISTIEIIDQISKQPKVSLIRQANWGLAKARNNGVLAAQGEYIIILDADNKLRPHFPEIAKDILDQNSQTDVVYGDAEFFGNKNSIWKGKPFDIKEMVLNNYIDACACIRKTALLKVGCYDEGMPAMGFEDWDLWLRLAVAGSGFKYVDDILFDYRVRNNSMLSDAWKRRQELVDYIFSKDELNHLYHLRNCLIENNRLKSEPSFKYILDTLMRKLKRSFRFG